MALVSDQAAPMLREEFHEQDGLTEVEMPGSHEPEWKPRGPKRSVRVPMVALGAVGVAVLALVACAAVFGASRSPPHRAHVEALGKIDSPISKILEQDPYDCDDSLANAAYAWSLHKKMWCCANKGHGCPLAEEVYMTFVLANIDYRKVTTTEGNLKGLLDKITDSVVAEVQLHDPTVDDDKVSIDYWEGSGIHSDHDSEDSRGMVCRVRVTTSSMVMRDNVMAALEESNLEFTLAEDLQPYLHDRELVHGEVRVKDLTVEAKIVDRCNCPDGTAEDGDKCPAWGGVMCKTCKAGFHLTTGKHCESNVCSCDNGSPATGISCPQHGERTCASCIEGFHMHDAAGSKCSPNQCECINGTAASGRGCYMHDGYICHSCDRGYHLDHTDKTCRENECFCNAGKKAGKQFCTKHGAEICESCDLGFHLDPSTGTCEPNVCLCEHGVPAEGRMCHIDNANICAYCDEGLLLSADRTCGKLHCVCPHGIPARGEECDTHGAVVCESCDHGYHMNSKQCVDIGCSCQNGIAAGEADCPVKGEELCVDCHFGYTLQGGSCVINECTCEHGKPAEGAMCRSPGVHSCGSCHPGYHHKLVPVVDSEGEKLTVTCQPNVCKCQDPNDPDRAVGIPATAESTDIQVCHTNGGNICQSCFAEKGFHLDHGYTCSKNVCKCEHGVAVDADDCPVHDAENCQEPCADGYFLADKPLEHWIQGKGVAPPKPEMFENGAKVCVESVLTTTLPFDCTTGQANWETAWSRRKKQWCCHNTRDGIGCIPTHTQKELCTSGDFSSEQCGLVGCCKYKGSCQPANDPGDRICHVEFNIKFRNNMCLTVPEESASSTNPVAYLDVCRFTNTGQDWAPTARGQIEDTMGNCLNIENDAPGGEVTARLCDDEGDVSDSQKISYEPRTMRLRSHAGNCFAVMENNIVLDSCDMANTNQQWLVPPVNPVGTLTTR